MRITNVARCRIEMDRSKRLQQLTGLLKDLSTIDSAEQQDAKLSFCKRLWGTPVTPKPTSTAVKVDAPRILPTPVDNTLLPHSVYARNSGMATEEFEQLTNFANLEPPYEKPSGR